MNHPIWLTPRLVVGGEPGFSNIREVITAQDAVSAIHSGHTALLPAGYLEEAKHAMKIMGATLEQIERTVTFGLTGRFPAAPGLGANNSSGDGLGDADELFPPPPA